MASYTYECQKCGKRFVRYFQPMPGKTRVRCECGAWAKKIVAGGNFILKGDTWAKDGYSKKPRR